MSEDKADTLEKRVGISTGNGVSLSCWSKSHLNLTFGLSSYMSPKILYYFYDVEFSVLATKNIQHDTSQMLLEEREGN